MVTCKVDTVAVSKMNSVRGRKAQNGGSNSSGFRLLDGDHLETTSSVSRNSVYKLKIDLMFDDSRSVRSNRLDDPRGSHRTRSIIMYGRSELASTTGDSSRSLTSFLQETNEISKMHTTSNTKKDVQRISNSVQAQIEQLFTDVAKDATSSFEVTCLGSLPMKDKVTSLQGLQTPLRDLYLKETPNECKNSGSLGICATGLQIKQCITEDKMKCSIKGDSETNITPFHNIAVWSAVKFVISDDGENAAFLPLITDPENIDKTSLFQPLSSAEEKQLAKSKLHAPLFAVVMRSSGIQKVLECHVFVCKSTEDAIVIAATLYQSLMAHVSSNSHRSTKRRTPRNQNGVSCISIASSSAITGSNYLSRSQIVSAGRKSSFRSSSNTSNAVPSRSTRKKRISNSSLSSSSNVINEAAETTTEERKRKSHKTKRAPVPPATTSGVASSANKSRHEALDGCKSTHTKKFGDGCSVGGGGGYRTSSGGLIGNGGSVIVVPAGVPNSSSSTAGGATLRSNDMNGDILTRVAIPRSGSFLNTGGLTRYKSRAARRHSGKLSVGGGGGGGFFRMSSSHMAHDCKEVLKTLGLDILFDISLYSPLGFSELFNEFRLHENLNSLDEILSVIIDADGMSFNDLKPIYKEFLLKLAVTLTKDELFQRSKNIMRRQKKRKLKRKIYGSNGSQKKSRPLLFSAKTLKKVFQLGQFRACRGKPPKPPRSRTNETNRRKSETPLTIGPPVSNQNTHQHRSRVATSGSDVSVIRNDNGLNGAHRNSSSGYVSCSECSYDSESCTCSTADRCYCSLREKKNKTNTIQNNNSNNNKLRRKSERNAAAAHASKKSNGSRNRNESNYTSGSITNRNSYISCKSDDKCYCSMVEEEPTLGNSDHDDGDETSSQTHSETTWCDTDSCLSASKCYCKRSEKRAQRVASRSNGRLASHSTVVNVTADSERSQQQRTSCAMTLKSSDKLALDYELFKVGGNGKSVQPHEALSMKKSVEAAAIFADVKLSQTTDISSLCPVPLDAINGALKSVEAKLNAKNMKNRDSCRSYTTNGLSSKQHHGRHSSNSIDRKNQRNVLNVLSSNASQKSCSADDLLGKMDTIEKAAKHNNSKCIYALKESFHSSNYQSMRAVSASLEDTLGYLP